MKPKGQGKARDARGLVLGSAVRVFARRGYAGTSVEDILAATGLSKPTLYYHFGSKAGLFRAILDFAFEEGFRLMRESVERSGASSCRDRLMAVAAAWFGFAVRHQDLTRLVFASTFASPEEIPAGVIDVSKRRRNVEFVLSIVAAGRAAGELADGFTDVEITDAFYGALIQQLRMHLIEPRGRLDRRRAARVVELLLKGAAASAVPA